MSKSWDEMRKNIDELRDRLSKLEARGSISPYHRRQERQAERSQDRAAVEWHRAAINPDFGLLAYEDDGSIIDHGDLLGLADDDHSLYLLKSGLREWDEQGGDPSTPASTKWKLYFKSGGLYLIDDAGSVTGPLIDSAGGVTDHGALTGLADDDHTQYLLISGSRAMTGSLNMGTNAITSMTTYQASIKTVSGSYSATASDHTLLADSSSADVTVTLLSSPADGQRLEVKKYQNANTVYVSGTTDRGALLTLDQPQHSVTLAYDSTEAKWFVIHESDWPSVSLLFPVIMATDGISTPFASDGYLGFGVSKVVGNSDERHATLAPAAGTIHSLSVEINGSAPGAGSWVLRLYKNGSPTDLTCTITGSNLAASDTSNRVTVAAGDYLTVFLDETGTLSNDMTITFVYEASYQPLFSHGNPVSSLSYGDLQSGQFTVGGDDGIATVFPCAGTLKNFAIRCTNCNASGDEVVCTIRKFDTSAGTWSDTALVITLNFDADGSAKVDTSSTLAVAAGDVLQVEYEETGGTVERTSFSCEFWPTVAGDRIVTGCVTTYSITGGGSSYAAVMGANQDDLSGSTAFEVNIPSPVGGTAQDLYFTTQAQPGGAKWIQAELMENGSGSGLAAKVTGASRQNSDTSNTVALTGGSDEIGIVLTDSNDSPASSTWLAWGLLIR